jgi:endonuclease/exonuclease/phosphatase family metal-dependent hydrolase
MLRASGTFWLSESPDAPGSLGWGAGLPRICTWARLIDRVTGQAMLHLNTHLDNRSPDARHHGAKLILERAAGLAEAGDAVILTGDMNCVAGSEPHEVFTSQLQDAADAAELELGERVTTGGFVTRPRPDDGSTPGPPTDRRIDYIFTTPNLRVSRYAVLSQHWRGRHASDHYPILADVELQHVV